jgi:hypothetical protein
MHTNIPSSPSVPADIGQITPEMINPQLLLDIADLIDPVISRNLPQKRSGFSYTVYIIFVCCIQLFQLSPRHTARIMHKQCAEHSLSFQRYQTVHFSNGKLRRFFPDQPSLSRCLMKLSEMDLIQSFWNYVLFAHLLILKSLNLLTNDLKLIADYTDTSCKKDKQDPYCFGKKKGKSVHRTLSFSIIAGDLHQMVANFKIQKRQDKLPLFEKILDLLQSNGFHVSYALLDRGFYRKRILKLLKESRITVIMPGRKCALTKQKILKYLKAKGKRYCKGFMKLGYIKKQGHTLLKFDLLLVAKRSHSLRKVHQDLKKNQIDLGTASKRIFPLIVLFAAKTGIKTLHGNENYIRGLYRQRWLIEIAFREMNRLGIGNKSQNRNIRLGQLGMQCLLYNMWQTQRALIKRDDPSAADLELNEFLGKFPERRYLRYSI